MTDCRSPCRCTSPARDCRRAQATSISVSHFSLSFSWCFGGSWGANLARCLARCGRMSSGVRPLAFRQWLTSSLPLPFRAPSLASLGSCLPAVRISSVPADLSWIRSADLAIVAVLGGVSVTWGPVLGAVAFYVAELWLSSLTIHWLLPFGILVILIGALLNGGLADIVALAFRPRPKAGGEVR